MVTTRGTRASSSILEEPLSVPPRSKKKVKKQLQAGTELLQTAQLHSTDSSLPNGTTNSMPHKRKSEAADTLSSTTSMSPNAKRVKLESSPSSTNGVHVQIPHEPSPSPDPPLPPPPEPEHATIKPTVQDTTMSSTDDIHVQAAKAAQAALLGVSQAEPEDTSTSYENGSQEASPPSQDTDQPRIDDTIDNEESSPSIAVTGTSIIDLPKAQIPDSPYNPSSDLNQATKPAASPLDSPYLQKHPQTNLPPHASYYQAHTSTGYGPPGQSQPTAVLYERARQVANSKSSTLSRNKTSNVSQRRPWTMEEEQALMDGLDQVKGPHWSQILVLYGPGGTVNETLRDRTQVQLKDKARNLKLFFLKSKIEVPYYLSFVTGELKSRAPSHVSTYDDTPPRSIGFPNGSNIPHSTSRNRPIPPSAPIPHPGMFNPLLHLPQTNGTYSSPYAALPGSQPPPVEEDVELQANDPAEIDDASHQNVADLADSAAAQVAAALANFNAMDMPNFDLPATMGSTNETTVVADPVGGTFTAQDG